MIVGVIGTGVMGRNHVRVLTDLKEVDEVYVFDINEAVAKRVSKEFNTSLSNSFSDLIKTCDVISICSPTKFHYAHINKCLKHEKHVFVEKPIADSYDYGKKIIELLKGKNLVFGVGHIERFNPIVNEIKDMNLNIKYVDVKRHNPASSRITDATVVEDLMIHDIDIIFNYLFSGEDFSLFAAGNKDVMQAIVKFNSSIVSISASRMSSKKIRKIYFESPDVTVEGDYMNQELLVYKTPYVHQSLNDGYKYESITEKILINRVEPLKVELKKFLECVDKGDEFPVTVDQAVNNLRICELVWRSAN